jgi:protein-S-isoprenylcysteine O-methyltransferase Ste14
MPFPKPYADAVARLRVPSGFLLLTTFAWLSRPSLDSVLLGAPIAFCGVLLRAWAAGHLEKNKRLVDSGPYRYTRNPLYLGTLITAAGLAVAARSWFVAAIFAAVFVFVYLPVIQLEGEHLQKLFPGYARYAERVPLLLPRFPGIPSTERFQWPIFVRNEEYKAQIGYVLGVAYLLWKTRYAS